MEKYLEECKDWTCKEGTVEEMWSEIKKKINEAMPKKKVKIRKWGMRRKRGMTRRGKRGKER